MILFSFPMTRFSTMEFVLGMWKFTVSFDAMEKFCQFIVALLVLWVMLVVAPLWLMLALPLVTCPPDGAADKMVTLPISAETTREIFPPFNIRNLEL